MIRCFVLVVWQFIKRTRTRDPRPRKRSFDQTTVPMTISGTPEGTLENEMKSKTRCTYTLFKLEGDALYTQPEPQSILTFALHPLSNVFISQNVLTATIRAAMFNCFFACRHCSNNPLGVTLYAVFHSRRPPVSKSMKQS